jgi:tetratricopeptide (TPR) repeat protein
MSEETDTNRRMTRPGHLAIAVLLALVVAAPAALGQSPEPKNNFIQAVGQFSVALDGAFGDEGGRIRSSLDSMERALTQWDGMVRTYETAMAADLRTAEPSLATRMHLAIAGIYLDRNRPRDALRELAAASQLDSTRADVPMFEALARSQLTQEPAQAIAALRRAATLNPGDSVTAYLLARRLMQSGAADEATRAIDRFRENETRRSAQSREGLAMPFVRLGLVQETEDIEPFFPPVLYAEGFAELQRGDYARAITQFREAATRDPLVSDPGVEAGALARAAAAARDGSVETALEQLRIAIELAPDRAEPHRLMGLAHLADRQFDEAVAALKTAIRLNPRDERARLALSDALIESDQLPAARQTLEDTRAMFPSSGRARYKLGLVYQRQGLYPDAVRELTASVTLKPLLGLNSIYETIGALARAQQDYDAAIAAFAERVDLIPNSADAHQELGEMYVRQGRHNEALAEFATTLMLRPARTDAYAAIGQVHLRDGQFAEAAAAARRAVAIDASHREARYVLGTSLIRLGQADQGKQELDVYQRLQSEATAARVRLLEIEGFRRDAAVSLASQDYEKAIGLLRQALEREPESAASHMDLGIALLKAGRTAESIERFTAAVARNAGEEAHGYLSQAYDALGRDDDSQRERDIYQRMRRDALRRAGAGR